MLLFKTKNDFVIGTHSTFFLMMCVHLLKFDKLSHYLYLFESKYCNVQSCDDSEDCDRGEDMMKFSDAFINAASLLKCYLDATDCDQNRRLGATTIHQTSVQSRQALLPAITWVGLASSFFGSLGFDENGTIKNAKWLNVLSVGSSFFLGSAENIMGPTWENFQAEFDRINGKLDDIKELIVELTEIIYIVKQTVLNTLFEGNDNESDKLTVLFWKYGAYLNVRKELVESGIDITDDEKLQTFYEDFKGSCKTSDTRTAPQTVFRHYYSQGCSKCDLEKFEVDKSEPQRSMKYYIDYARLGYLGPDGNDPTKYDELNLQRFRTMIAVKMFYNLMRSIMAHVICPANTIDPCEDVTWTEALQDMLNGLNEVAHNLDFLEKEYLTYTKKQYRIAEVTSETKWPIDLRKPPPGFDGNAAHELFVATAMSDKSSKREYSQYWPKEEKECEEFAQWVPKEGHPCTFHWKKFGNRKNRDWVCRLDRVIYWDSLPCGQRYEDEVLPIKLNKIGYLKLEDEGQFLSVKLMEKDQKKRDNIALAVIENISIDKLLEESKSIFGQLHFTEVGKGSILIEVLSIPIKTIDTLKVDDDPPTDLDTLGDNDPCLCIKSVRATYYDMEGYNSIPTCGLKSIRHYKTETVGTIGFSTTTGNFAGSGRDGYVGALFHGTLKFPKQGLTTLCVTSDDEIQLRIDDELFFAQKGVMKSCKDVTFNGEHEVEVEYFEGRT